MNPRIQVKRNELRSTITREGEKCLLMSFSIATESYRYAT